jgi:hypothetical protein
MGGNAGDELREMKDVATHSEIDYRLLSPNLISDMITPATF